VNGAAVDNASVDGTAVEDATADGELTEDGSHDGTYDDNDDDDGSVVVGGTVGDGSGLSVVDGDSGVKDELLEGTDDISVIGGSVVYGSCVNAIVEGTTGDAAVVMDGEAELNDKVVVSNGDGDVVLVMTEFVVGATVIDIG
jgi:hypothetical protein